MKKENENIKSFKLKQTVKTGKLGVEIVWNIEMVEEKNIRFKVSHSRAKEFKFDFKRPL